MCVCINIYRLYIYYNKKLSSKPIIFLYLRIILAWIDGGAIFIAVALITLVGSIVDYRKEKQFQKMNAYANAKKVV